jgi:hypothetical protein
MKRSTKYYSERYVRANYPIVNIEWDLDGADTAYERFVNGEITIYQARAMIYSTLLKGRGNNGLAYKGDTCLLHNNEYFYSMKYGELIFDYDKIMTECSCWLLKNSLKNKTDKDYVFGSIKATMEYVKKIKPELTSTMHILDVALGIERER